MIIDSLQNADLYYSINPYFKKAFEYLKTLNLANLAPSKTHVLGDAIIVNINEVKLKNKSDTKLEAHNKYIDIQIPLNAVESFGWKDRAECKDAEILDKEKDLQFFADKASTYFSLQAGEFVVFFPHDAHAPSVGEGVIKKIVIKILVENL
ncbi:beta-D-galactosidase [Bacteroidales bacterium]|nr:beta-D-galactosidase [Bacteroidales bacterium]